MCKNLIDVKYVFGFLLIFVVLGGERGRERLREKIWLIEFWWVDKKFGLGAKQPSEARTQFFSTELVSCPKQSSNQIGRAACRERVSFIV